MASFRANDINNLSSSELHNVNVSMPSASHLPNDFFDDESFNLGDFHQPRALSSSRNKPLSGERDQPTGISEHFANLNVTNPNNSNDFISNNVISPEQSSGVPPLELPGTYNTQIINSTKISSSHSDEMPPPSTPQNHHRSLHQQQTVNQNQHTSGHQQQTHTPQPWDTTAAPISTNFDDGGHTNIHGDGCESPLTISNPTPQAPYTPHLSHVSNGAHHNQRDLINMSSGNHHTSLNFATDCSKNANQSNLIPQLQYGAPGIPSELDTSPMTVFNEGTPKPRQSMSTPKSKKKSKGNSHNVATSSISTLTSRAVRKSSKRKSQSNKSLKKRKTSKIKLCPPDHMDIAVVRAKANSGRDEGMENLERKVGPCDEEQFREFYNRVVKRAWNVTEDEKVKERSRRRDQIPQRESRDADGTHRNIDSKDASRLEAALSRYRKDVLIQVLLEEIKVLIKDKLTLNKVMRFVPNLNQILPNINNEADSNYATTNSNDVTNNNNNENTNTS